MADDPKEEINYLKAIAEHLGAVKEAADDTSVGFKSLKDASSQLLAAENKLVQ